MRSRSQAFGAFGLPTEALAFKHLDLWIQGALPVFWRITCRIVLWLENPKAWLSTAISLSLGLAGCSKLLKAAGLPGISQKAKQRLPVRILAL